MPMTAGFRLTEQDYQRLKEYAHRSERSLADVCRAAVLEYIDKVEGIEDDSYFLRKQAERDKQIVAALKSLEHRLASLLVRVGLDTNFSIVMNASMLEEDDPAKKLAFYERCRQEAYKRFRKDLRPLEKGLVEALKVQGDALTKLPDRGASGAEKKRSAGQADSSDK